MWWVHTHFDENTGALDQTQEAILSVETSVAAVCVCLCSQPFGRIGALCYPPCVTCFIRLLFTTAMKRSRKDSFIKKVCLFALTLSDRVVQALVRAYSGSHHLMADGKGRFTCGRKKSHD